MVHEIENFYGVYLLYSLNPKYKGRTYIGFTVDPNRRVQQHNNGVLAGGAKRTNGRGPWEMVLIVHGFPNMISALRFEWAWTKPKKSRRLRHLANKRARETKYHYCIRVMCEMLRTGPWDRLPLTIRWLKQEYMVNFDAKILPPPHMPIAYGPVKSLKVKKTQQSQSESASQSSLAVSCNICKLVVATAAESIACLNCNVQSHIACMAKSFLQQKRQADDQLLPIEGQCVQCDVELLWGDLVRYKRGCYRSQLNARGEFSAEDST